MIMGLYAGFSFSISIIAIYNDPRFAFYFPICRFWQMAIGGILAYLNININNSKLNDFISIFSVMAIIVTSFVINDNSLFPGFWALIPTLSSACIIQAKGKAFANKHILSNKVVVFIGKISYSLYLWHWPLLVFSRSFYPKGSTSIFSNLFLIILITFVLTILTHFIV
jgi:peptidoglycan/LPS O-acetylase OafA/YrhL